MNRKFWTLLVTIIGSGIVLLDGSVTNLALPALSQELGASFSQLQWVVDGYLLSLSALILLGGSLGDIFGRRRMYVIGLIGFGVTSVLCGLAPNAELLIAARVLQGVFGALVVPGGLAIINTNFAASERGKAIGIWSAWSGVAAAVAPLLGGVLIDALSWRWIFFINAPFVVACVYLALKHVDESALENGRRVDYQGAALAVGFLAAITFGLIEGPVRSWDMLSVGALFVGAILFILFIVVEFRKRDPMVDLKLFKSRNFTGANIMTFAMYGALSGFFFALVIYLQNTLQFSSTMAGLSLLPVSILLLLFAGKVGELVGIYGARIFMTAGPILCAIAMLLMLTLAPGANFWLHVLPPITLFGCGMVLLVAPLTVTVMNAVHDKQSGIASGINNAVSRAAGLIVIALLGLFGASSYHASVLLCAGLAFGAGIVSFLTIRDHALKKSQVQ
jgi:EmrB/QacA subfamily drug resistance transporter